MGRWKYYNKTNGKSFECNDVNYLLFHLRNQRDLMIPVGTEVTLNLWGRAELVVSDGDGVLNHIVLLDENREEVAFSTKQAVQ